MLLTSNNNKAILLLDFQVNLFLDRSSAQSNSHKKILNFDKNEINYYQGLSILFITFSSI